jgi:hypothetical protein
LSWGRIPGEAGKFPDSIRKSGRCGLTFRILAVKSRRHRFKTNGRGMWVLKKGEQVVFLTPSPQPLSPEFKGEGLKTPSVCSVAQLGKGFLDTLIPRPY